MISSRKWRTAICGESCWMFRHLKTMLPFALPDDYLERMPSKLFLVDATGNVAGLQLQIPPQGAEYLDVLQELW